MRRIHEELRGLRWFLDIGHVGLHSLGGVISGICSQGFGGISILKMKIFEENTIMVVGVVMFEEI